MFYRNFFIVKWISKHFFFANCTKIKFNVQPSLQIRHCYKKEYLHGIHLFLEFFVQFSLFAFVSIFEPGCVTDHWQRLYFILHARHIHARVGASWRNKCSHNVPMHRRSKILASVCKTRELRIHFLNSALGGSINVYWISFIEA